LLDFQLRQEPGRSEGLALDVDLPLDRGKVVGHQLVQPRQARAAWLSVRRRRRKLSPSLSSNSAASAWATSNMRTMFCSGSSTYLLAMSLV